MRSIGREVVEMCTSAYVRKLPASDIDMIANAIDARVAVIADEEVRNAMKDAPLMIGQIVLAAGGEVRVPMSQLRTVDRVRVTRTEDVATGDTIFTAEVTSN